MKLGVTVDPVRINSLEAFGSLTEVTERVLSVEKTRDGVNQVCVDAETELGIVVAAVLCSVVVSARRREQARAVVIE